MMFRVGQKVARWGGTVNRNIAFPAIDEPVTVSAIYTTADGIEKIELIEYPSPEDSDFYSGLRASFFRPIIERKTDISVFTNMLTNTKVRA
jgi:hypothetical protein